MKQKFKASNPVLQTMLNHKSVRNYQEEMPAEETIEKIVRAGQQAPFVSQLYSILLARKGDKNNIAFGAPLLFTLCVDIHKLKKVMEKRGWELVTNDISLLIFGIQDAAYLGQNMVTAAESLGLGTCFLGGAPYYADKIREEYELPDKVFPLVQLVMGYPAEEKPPRPRYPLDFVLFEDKYPEFSEEQLAEAMEVMDQGYLEQDYYRDLQAKIPLEEETEDEYSYENYSWTEHISRKWGQWHENPREILKQLSRCGFEL